jgi:CP family cyanate transporter-like MFS transporter
VQNSRPAPIWAGRGLAVVGLVALALNLRTAVAVFSPIIDEVGADIPLTTASIGVLGMLPPVCFALFGLLAPTVARRAGLELTVVCALVAMTVGHLVRGLSGSVEVFGLATVLTLGGMGFGNVLMPPLIKRYFPDRIGLFTSVTTVMLSLSTGVPTLIAAPVADTVGWRVAIGSWAALALVALVPWIALLVEHRRRVSGEATPELAGAASGPLGRAWRSPVAWAIMLVQAASSFNAYAMFAWLPLLLVEVAGQTPASAGALLSIFGFAGLPTAIIVPFLVVRMRNVGILVQVGVGFFLAGYAGLLFAPTTLTWLWVLFAGLGPILFPVTLVLINVRTRTQRGSVVLSGFSQGFGYVIGALGPLLFGLVHEVTGSWQVPLVMLLVPVAVASVAGVYLAKPHMLEDSWHGKTGPGA